MIAEIRPPKTKLGKELHKQKFAPLDSFSTSELVGYISWKHRAFILALLLVGSNTLWLVHYK